MGKWVCEDPEAGRKEPGQALRLELIALSPLCSHSLSTLVTIHIDTHCILERTNRASLVAHMVKNLPAMRETWVQSLGREDPLGKGMATHSSILAWRIPWTEEPSRLQSMGLCIGLFPFTSVSMLRSVLKGSMLHEMLQSCYSSCTVYTTQELDTTERLSPPSLLLLPNFMSSIRPRILFG